MITQQELRSIIKYDPGTGIFYRISNGKKTGSVMRVGYIVVTIGKKFYLAHRLAWLYVHGEWPQLSIDHINMDKTDNRISNLRLASKSQNAFNTDKHRSASGIRGVYFQKNTKKWRVKFGNRHIGYFDSKEEAGSVWQKMYKESAGEFARA